MTKQFFAILGFLAIFTSVQSVAAQEVLLNEFTSYIEISENSGSVRIILPYVVLHVGENVLQDSIYVSGALSGVNARDRDGALTHSENIEDSFTRVQFNLRQTLIEGDRSTVTVEFTKPTTVVNGIRLYEIGYLWSTGPNIHQVIVTMPRGTSY